eukprot:3255369-Pyramimonas_sp.AAC.1
MPFVRRAVTIPSTANYRSVWKTAHRNPVLPGWGSESAKRRVRPPGAVPRSGGASVAMPFAAPPPRHRRRSRRMPLLRSLPPGLPQHSLEKLGTLFCHRT